jgi:glycosyltransferase involved in cell wall biosynthesis
MERTKYLLVTDIPSPWREKVYECVYRELGDDFQVVYCGRNEKRRLWNFPHGSHNKVFLNAISLGGRHWERFINPGILKFVIKKRPRVIVGFSMNPSVVISFLLSKLLNYKTAVFADTWLGRDAGISGVQKIARKIMYRHLSDAYIGASKQTLAMYRHYNKSIKEEALFLSALCADNDFFRKKLKGEELPKKYDIMFAGRIVKMKNPLFFADVALKIKARRGSCTALIIGKGDREIETEMFARLDKGGVDYFYGGFVPHSELPYCYKQARILLLPTSGDCWGVVINEAFVSGLPVITTPHTAAAGELVLNGENGHILELDATQWADKVVGLLDNEAELKRMSANARQAVGAFNFEKASEGIVSAIRYLDAKIG